MTVPMLLPFLGVILPAIVLAQTDTTLQAGAAGKDVVMATIQKLHETCFFQHDNLFLRRLAFVLTRYGTEPGTYRQGYDGGIWQINMADFQATQNYTNDKQTTKHFGFRWSDMTWSDLRKPLYSAIAAGFVALSKLPKFPVEEDEQAELFRKMYGKSSNDFLTIINGLDAKCTSEELDIVFILDASGSVSAYDYEISKNFTAQVISKFDVGPNSVRVALISYSTTPTLYFDFSAHNSSQAAQRAALAIGKADMGTSTWLALDMAADSLFSNQTTRDGVAKVAIVLTDGHSTLSLTNASAENLKNLNVEVFAVGIGHYTKQQELNAIASEPDCMHTREPETFSELIPLIADIKETSCTAAPVVDTNSNNTYSCLHDKTFKLDLQDGDSILIRPLSGQVTFYGSFSTDKPNQAVHDFDGVAITWKPVVIYATDTQGTISLTVQASNSQTGSCQSRYELVVYPNNILNFQVENRCVKSRHLTNCTYIEIFTGTVNGIPEMSEGDVAGGGSSVTRDPDSVSPTVGTAAVPTPSTMRCPGAGPGKFQHPTSLSSFVVCLENGLVYEFPCPEGLTYDINTEMCSKAAVATSDSDKCKVCTRENWVYGLKKFAVPGKMTSYLECSYVGMCVVKTCNASEVWNETRRECESTLPTTPPRIGLIQFDCSAGVQGQRYFSYPATRYFFVICDGHGNAFLLQCPLGTRWEQKLLSCVNDIDW